MAIFKILAGDFGQDRTGYVYVGRWWSRSSQGFKMPKGVKIPPGEIESLELATQESARHLGVLNMGSRGKVSFVCQFKDGRKFLGSCDFDAYNVIQKAKFPLPPEEKVVLTGRQVLWAIGGLGMVICLFLLIAAMGHSSAPTAAKSVQAGPTVNERAVKVVATVMMDDFHGSLVGDKSIERMPESDAYTWLKIDQSVAATKYLHDYTANEVAADHQYKNRTLLLKGTVSRVGRDVLDHAYIELSGSMFQPVHAGLDDKTDASPLNSGEAVRLVCKGDGMVLLFPGVRDCEFFEDYFSRSRPSIEARVKDFLTAKTALSKQQAQVIAATYVASMAISNPSACEKEITRECKAQVDALKADKASMDALRKRVNQLLLGLKTE